MTKFFKRSFWLFAIAMTAAIHPAMPFFILLPVALGIVWWANSSHVQDADSDL